MKKIVVFITVVLALIMCMASCDKPKAVAHVHSFIEKTENQIQATCTTDGSHDNITYCCTCGYELKRESVVVPAFGHTTDVKTTNVIAPTCTQTGSYDEITYCKTCNEELSNKKNVINKLEHNLVSESEFDVKACGVDEAYKICYCLNCKNFIPADKEITLHTHDYERLSDDESWYFKCKICGHEHRDIKLSLYSPHEFIITSYKAPTCTESGTSTLTCTKCGYFYKQYISALGHDYEYEKTLSEPTCTLDGEELHKCIRCEKTTYVTVDALGHAYIEEISEESKSCVEKGIKQITCERCNYTDYIDYYADHQYSERECVQKENCTTTGIYVEVCIVCSHENTSYKYPSHNYNNSITIVYPKCLENGLIRITCTLCGTSTDEDIPALGHEWKVLSEKDPICTNNGYRFDICTRCGSHGYTEHPALGHEMHYKYDENNHWLVCIRCDKIDISEEHQLETTIKTIEFDDGTQIIYSHTLLNKCTTCEYKRALDDAKLHIHYAVEIIEGSDPSCKDFWWAPGLKCAVDGCNEVLIERTKIEPIEHEWENGRCIRCGAPQLEMKLSTDGTYYIVTGMGEYDGTVLDIPATYKKKPVQEIAIDAFKNGSSLINVSIPNSVTCIGKDAFYGCSSLESVYITDITAWCEISFYNYYSNPLYYANNLYLIENGTPKLITDLIIPEGVTNIGSYAFYNCSNLTSITIPDSVKNIGSDAFFLNSTISVYITDIAAWCGISFYDYSSNPLSNNLYLIKNGEAKLITDLVIPDTVTSISDYSFFGYAGLRSITIPDSVTSIGDYAFSDCGNLISVTIPDSVTSIGDYAFYYCFNLKNVSIPDSVTNIGFRAFGHCESLTNITVDENNTTYKSLNGNLYTKDGKTLLQYAIGKADSSFDIPINVTHIGDYAFYDCFNLKNVSIPDSVTRIGNAAFGDCVYLTSVSIPDSVTHIGDGAFYDCFNLTNVSIPDSVISIGNQAFDGCNYLIEIENGVHYADKWVIDYDDQESNNNEVVLRYNTVGIADYAFYYSPLLKNITIPDSTIIIGNYAFESCKNLTNITIGKGVTNIGDYAFADCTNLSTITIPNSIANIGKYAFANCSSLICAEYDNAYYLGDEINPYVILIRAKDKNIVSCTIHSNTKFINDLGFYGCDSLISIAIPDNVISIGNYAFAYCSGLVSITIPNSVVNIGNYAFHCCFGLTNITVDENNTAYKSLDGSLYTKDGKTLLRYAIGKTDSSFTIPDSVTSIGNSAFAYCLFLESITIPDSITSIDWFAFGGCISITSVIFENTEGWWYSPYLSATSGTNISATDLADPTTAATYLTSTYDICYWKRA